MSSASVGAAPSSSVRAFLNLVAIEHSVFALPFALGGLITHSWEGAVTGLIWGGLVRLFFNHHITWSVNSLSHVFGYRTYETGENSRNNWLVGLISNGEGWHNNHHADQRSAAHGHQWWELDVTYLTIRALEAVGLATECLLPNRRLLDPARVGKGLDETVVD